MNEQQEIFTSGTFGDPAVIQQTAVKMNAPPIDPHNPFENETEYHDYQPDYGYIVPQIRIPGCRIPLRPNKMERKGIRKYCSIAGGGVLAHFLLTNLLAFLLIQVIYLMISVTDQQTVSPLPANYDILLMDYFENSSAYIAMTIIVFVICNAGIALLGCKISKISVSSLFQTKNLTASRMISYIFIAVGLQLICGYLALLITELMSAGGITAYEADFSTTTDVKCVVLMAVYTCIIAPVTEELFYRGFLMKNLSRVSQRFGIMASAVLFGLAHENVTQFVLAFTVGVFMGYLTVKHNSLVPGIIAHIAVNTMSEIFSLIEMFGTEAVYALANLAYLAAAIAGIVLLVRMLIRERIPYTVPHQQERGLRIALTSIPLWLGAACHIASAVLLIMDSSQ